MIRTAPDGRAPPEAGDELTQNAPTGRLAGLSVQQKHVDAQKMLYFTVFLALEGS